MCAGSQERGDDGSSDESSDYSGSSDASSDVVSFVPIDKRNPHWSAAERRAEASSEPRRYSLYGNKTADALSKEREGGGLLGFSLSWHAPSPLTPEQKWWDDNWRGYLNGVSLGGLFVIEDWLVAAVAVVIISIESL